MQHGIEVVVPGKFEQTALDDGVADVPLPSPLASAVPYFHAGAGAAEGLRRPGCVALAGEIGFSFGGRHE